MKRLSITQLNKATSTIVDVATHDGKQPVSFAVVDSSGSLLFFASMDEAPQRLASIAIAKAYTAARMQATTQNFQKRLQNEGLRLEDFADPSLTSLPGGVPLILNNQSMGGVGVSGRALAEDHELAEKYAQLLLGHE